MQNVLADLAVESEAMMWMSMRLASAFDRSEADESERLLSRLATPVAKYWACKRAPQFVVEALDERHGGTGFIADHLMERPTARLRSTASGKAANVICHDVLRAMQRARYHPAAFGRGLPSARC
jgi:putative acyl-CoA dehydrogenase